MMRNEEKGAACAFGMCFQGLLWGAADLWTWPGADTACGGQERWLPVPSGGVTPAAFQEHCLVLDLPPEGKGSSWSTH